MASNWRKNFVPRFFFLKFTLPAFMSPYSYQPSPSGGKIADHFQSKKLSSKIPPLNVSPLYNSREWVVLEETPLPTSSVLSRLPLRPGTRESVNRPLETSTYREIQEGWTCFLYPYMALKSSGTSLWQVGGLSLGIHSDERSLLPLRVSSGSWLPNGGSRWWSSNIFFYKIYPLCTSCCILSGEVLFPSSLLT